MTETLLERDDQNLMIFTINRPTVRNAINYDVMEHLKEAIEAVKKDSTIKGFVITGAGNEAFCSGGDLKVFHSLHTKEEAYSMLKKMGDILYDLMTLDRPTFAIVNGSAVGGGCEILTACDFRLAKETSKFGFIQGRLGITTGWGGGTMLLEKLPPQYANQLLFSAKIFQAKEGFELGFMNQLLQDDNVKSEGIQWIHDLLQNVSPNVLRAYKNIAIKKWISNSLKERMEEEMKECARLWEQDEHHQAVNHFFMNKKK